jgi:hypothetical protein
LGILGYFLGSRRLGTVTVLLCVAALFFGLAASQGLIPGIDASDRGLPAKSPPPNKGSRETRRSQRAGKLLYCGQDGEAQAHTAG